MASGNREQALIAAWQQQRAGRGEEAARGFEELLRREPQNFEAGYGLGMARKATGNAEAATSAFRAALRDVIHERERLESGRDLEHENQEEAHAIDRFMMLERMIRQRLAEIAGGK